MQEFFSAFLCFSCEIFSIFPRYVWLLGSLGPFDTALFSPKKTPKGTLFQTEEEKKSQKAPSLKLFFSASVVLFLHKEEAHTMNVLSTHAVALHNVKNAPRGSQRTSASTSSLIARKNTRSYNKKNINTARHRNHRSIIRYARQ